MSDNLRHRACSACFYWDAGESGNGLCRRRAPRPINGSYAEWPITRASDWCGDLVLRREITKNDLLADCMEMASA